MNRKDIIKYLKKYNFNPKKYLVIGGAAMVLYGFKDETRDINIATTKEYKKELIKNYNSVIEDLENDTYMIDDTISFGSNNYKRRKEYIEGFPVIEVVDLIFMKKKLNRPKDRKDLKIIFDKLK